MNQIGAFPFNLYIFTRPRFSRHYLRVLFSVLAVLGYHSLLCVFVPERWGDMEMMMMPESMWMFMVPMPTNSMWDLPLAFSWRLWRRVVMEESVMVLMVAVPTDTMRDFAFCYERSKRVACIWKMLWDIAEVEIVMVFVIAMTADAVRDATPFSRVKAVDIWSGGVCWHSNWFSVALG